MKCPYCQHDVLDGALVCTHCKRDFSVLIHVLRDVEQARDEAQSELGLLKEEVESVTRRLARAEARLPTSATVSAVSASQRLLAVSKTNGLAVAGVTSLGVALTSWLSWRLKDQPIGEPLLALSYALAPAAAAFFGFARKARYLRTTLLLGLGAAVAIIVVHLGLRVFERASWLSAGALVLAALAAGRTGRTIRDVRAKPDSNLPLSAEDMEKLADTVPRLKPLASAVIALTPLVISFLAGDDTQDDVQEDETATIETNEDVAEKEKDAQAFVTQPTVATTTPPTAPTTSSTANGSSGGGATPSTDPDPDPDPNPDPDPDPVIEQSVLTLEDVVGNRLLEGGLLSPLQQVAESADLPPEERSVVLLAESSEDFQQKLRTLQAMNLVSFTNDDFTTIELKPWGRQVLASIAGVQASPDIVVLAPDPALTNNNPLVKVDESGQFPVYVRLELAGESADAPTAYAIEANRSTEEGDPRLSLFTFDERAFIGRDDDGGGDFNARLVVCLRPGKYLIEVNRVRDVGGFDVSLAEAPGEAECETS